MFAAVVCIRIYNNNGAMFVFADLTVSPFKLWWWEERENSVHPSIQRENIINVGYTKYPFVGLKPLTNTSGPEVGQLVKYWYKHKRKTQQVTSSI